MGYAKEKADLTFPWTDDLPETFAAAYDGEDLLGAIPELVWEPADKAPSLIRYHYHADIVILARYGLIII